MARPSETAHLLVNTASKDSSSPLQQKSICVSCPPSKHLCLPSKAVIRCGRLKTVVVSLILLLLCLVILLIVLQLQETPGFDSDQVLS